MATKKSVSDNKLLKNPKINHEYEGNLPSNKLNRENRPTNRLNQQMAEREELKKIGGGNKPLTPPIKEGIPKRQGEIKKVPVMSVPEGVDPKMPYLPDGSPNFQYQPMSMSEKSVNQPGNVMASTSVTKNVPTPQSHLDAFAQYDANKTAGVGSTQTPQSHLDAFAQYDAQQGSVGQGQPSQTRTTTQQQTQNTLTAPKAPTFTPITTQAPDKTELPKVSSRQERQVRKSVLDDYKPVFDALGNIERLASEGKTAEIDLITRQTNDVIALLDQQMAQFEELKKNKDLTANEFAELERQREEVAREKLLAQNALDRADTAAKYKDAEQQRIQFNEQQKVRLETFAGLRNGFGSSAYVQNLENTMSQGQNALDSLRREATQYDAKYANEALNIEKDYNLNISNINTNLNSTIRQNYNDLQTAIMTINQNKLSTQQQKEQAILQAEQNYRNTVIDNQLRTIDLIREQNNEIQRRIEQTRTQQLNDYQIKRDEEWRTASFNADKEKYNNEIAAQNFNSQLQLYSTISNIMAQDASNDLELKRLQENIRQYNVNMDMEKDKFELNKNMFDKEYALNVAKTNADIQNQAIQTAISEYQNNKKMQMEERMAKITEQQLKLDQIKILKSGYYEVKNSDGKIYFYNPSTGQTKKPEDFEDEAELTMDYQYYKEAASLIPGMTKEERANFENVVLSSIQRGDDEIAQQAITSKALQGSSNALIKSMPSTIAGLKEIKKELQRLQDAGVNTGFMTGSLESIANTLAKTSDPRLANLNTKITAVLGVYRNAITGAAWGAKEDAEYQKMFPGIIGSNKYNQTKIDSLTSTWDSVMKAEVQNMITPTLFNRIYGVTQLSDGTSIDDLDY